MSTQIGVRHKLPDQLVGFDCFTSGSRVLGTPNPFDVGVVGYSRDFWTPGRELGVGYDPLYEILPEGFREARSRCEREVAEETSIGRKVHCLWPKLGPGFYILFCDLIVHTFYM